MFNRPFVSLALVQLRSRGFLLSRGKLDLSRSLRLFCLAVSFAPLLLSSPVVVYAQPDSTQEVYQYVMQWGTTGSDTGQFNGAGGMCIDDSGYIYVCDRWNNRIQKFDTNGRFILKWGSLGSGQGQFNQPFDIARDHSGFVYVNDNGNGRIQKFDSRGNFILMWSDNAAGLDVSPSNLLYIADGGSSPHESLKVYDTLGNHLRSFGNPDTTEWWLPEGVAVDDSGFVYVSKYSGNLNYILKFDTSGVSLLRWGSNGTGDGQFGEVLTMRTGEKFKVFTPDAPTNIPNYRVQKFTSGGIFITKWGSQGNGNGEFQAPFSAVIDSAGFVYVSDFYLNRIQKFRKTIVGVNLQDNVVRGVEKPISIECFPNPMKIAARLKFTLSQPGEFRLSFYNAAGQRIRGFASSINGPGLQEMVWDGRDEKGRAVPSGVYFVTLENNKSQEIIKITVTR
jgi:hypothetical protein